MKKMGLMDILSGKNKFREYIYPISLYYSNKRKRR